MSKRSLPDYYEVLQVRPDADQEVIQAAYRRLSRKFDPTRNSDPGAKLRIEQLRAAYAVLGSRRRRAEYDAEMGFPDDASVKAPVRASAKAPAVASPKVAAPAKAPRVPAPRAAAPRAPAPHHRAPAETALPAPIEHGTFGLSETDLNTVLIAAWYGMIAIVFAIGIIKGIQALPNSVL